MCAYFCCSFEGGTNDHPHSKFIRFKFATIALFHYYQCATNVKKGKVKFDFHLRWRSLLQLNHLIEQLDYLIDYPKTAIICSSIAGNQSKTAEPVWLPVTNRQSQSGEKERKLKWAWQMPMNNDDMGSSINTFMHTYCLVYLYANPQDHVLDPTFEEKHFSFSNSKTKNEQKRLCLERQTTKKADQPSKAFMFHSCRCHTTLKCPLIAT